MKHGLRRLRCAALPFALGLMRLPPSAQELKIGVASEVTSIDPHFHNVGPNNSLRRHIFQAPRHAPTRTRSSCPSSRASWRAVDDKTWEFKLRPGVKFTNGAEFTAKDVIYTLCRIPTVENSPSSFTVYTRGFDAIETPDPLTLVFKTTNPTPLLPNNLSTLGILSAEAYGGGRVKWGPGGCENLGTPPKSADFNEPREGGRHRPLQARQLHPRHAGRARAQRRLLGRQAALAEGDLAAVLQRRPARRGAARRRRRPDREPADPGLRQDQGRRLPDRRRASRTASSTCTWTSS